MFIGARGRSGKKRSPSQGQALCETLYSLRLACVSLTLSWERLSSLFYREGTEAQRVQVTCPRSEGWSQPNWVGTPIHLTLKPMLLPPWLRVFSEEIYPQALRAFNRGER